jgi:hypothetical protein
MLMRVHLLTIVAVLTASVGVAAPPSGSTIATAIPLKQRDPAKAVEEEMQWMMRLYRYTPVLATRDEIAALAAEAVRRLRAGQKPASGKRPAPWEHGSLDRNGRLISYWVFRTPRGKKEVYFDTGVPINAPGELARQEFARAQYIGRVMQAIKIQ